MIQALNANVTAPKPSGRGNSPTTRQPTADPVDQLTLFDYTGIATPSKPAVPVFLEPDAFHHAHSDCPKGNYTGQLSFLDESYPGVTSRLHQAEHLAEKAGFSEERAPHFIAQILEAPPWPTGGCEDPIAKIGAHARTLHEAHPHLTARDHSAYDAEQAKRQAESLSLELKELFSDPDFKQVNLATRAKTPESLGTKLARQTAAFQDFTLAHVTDTVGARLDCPDLNLLSRVARCLERHFGDKIVAKSDYLSNPGANGYRALHYTVDQGDRMAEIQVSTADLRSADLATHDTLYKPLLEPLPDHVVDHLKTAADRIMYAECWLMPPTLPGMGHSEISWG